MGIRFLKVERRRIKSFVWDTTSHNFLRYNENVERGIFKFPKIAHLTQSVTAVVPEKPASASRRRGPPASRQGRGPSKLIATSRRSIICSHSSPGSHLGSSRQRRGSPKAAARRRIKIPGLSYIIYNKPGFNLLVPNLVFYKFS